MKQFSAALERAGVTVDWKIEQVGSLVERLYYIRYVGVPIVLLNTFLRSFRLRKAVSGTPGKKVVLVTEPLTAIALWRSSAPIAYWCISGVVEWWHLQSRIEKLSVIFSSVVEVVAARMATAVISESQRIAGLLASAAKVPVHVIPWGVDSEVFTPEKRKTGSAALTVLFAGLIRDAKGVDTLVDACCALAGEFDMRLRIVGPILPAWRRFAESLKHKANASGLKLEFTGYMPWDKLSVVMANADVLVIPSRHEGLANVVLESMASGIPVLCSRVAGMPEVVEKNRCGLVFNPNDVNSLVKQLRLVLGDRQLRQTFGINGRRAALEYYSWDAVAKTMLRTLGLPSLLSD